MANKKISKKDIDEIEAQRAEIVRLNKELMYAKGRLTAMMVNAMVKKGYSYFNWYVDPETYRIRKINDKKELSDIEFRRMFPSGGRT